MKKAIIILMSFVAMLAAGTSLKAQEVTITLIPGWTWISCPTTDTVDFATALGDFTPMQGDIIKSQWGASTYLGNRWRGAISQFYPGYGYHYYSNRAESVQVTMGIPLPQVSVVTAAPTDITANSATSGGSITTDAYVFAKGICWATHPDPTPMDDDHSLNGGGDESFTAEMTDLSQNTMYYVRAYAVTQNGIAYGNQQSFSTESASGGDHAYVDLGLPSGLLWATCNVGADAPEDYGDYFAWGETTTKSAYNWSTYQYCNGSYNTLTKYCNSSNYGYNGFTDNLTTLLPEDDAATANWGNGWRMPTQAEFQELLDNTTVTWTTQNGVTGRLFTASNGNSLFLPAAGCRDNSSLYGAGSNGYYWSSSLYTDDPYYAWYFYFNSGLYYMYYRSRCYGFTVRPVCSSRQN